jgi:hypothetical protein
MSEPVLLFFFLELETVFMHFKLLDAQELYGTNVDAAKVIVI